MYDVLSLDELEIKILFKKNTYQLQLLSNFHPEQPGGLSLNILVDQVDFVLGEGAVHVTVHNTVAVARPAAFWVDKLIEQVHLFDEVPAKTADQVIKVVL